MEILLCFEVHLVLLLAQLLNALMIKHQGKYVFQKKLQLINTALTPFGCNSVVGRSWAGRSSGSTGLFRSRPFPAGGGAEGWLPPGRGHCGLVARYTLRSSRENRPRGLVLPKARSCLSHMPPACSSVGECLFFSACGFLTCEVGL